MNVRAWIIERVTRRPADVVIGGHASPYMLRWFVLPRNPLLNVYVHQFKRSDDDRAHHDHPWLFNASWLLAGQYIERTIRAGGSPAWALRRAGDMKFRWGAAPHRIELLQDPFAVVHHPMHCWTLFVTGPRVREWGFHCTGRGWVHWKQFTAADDPGAIGKGCDS